MGSRAVLATVIAALTLTATVARAGLEFVPQGGVAINPGVDAIATADLNRDGRLDAVLLSDVLAEVQVFLNGDRGLALRGTYQVGDALRQLAVGDLDGDAVPDVACTERLPPGVWILLGRGDGTLHEPYKVDVGRSPQAIAIADVDGRDGNDLVVTDTLLGKVLIQLNTGQAPPAFREALEVDVGEGPTELLVVDVSRDRRPDLVTLNTGAPRAREVAVSRLVDVVDGVPQFETTPQRIAVDRPARLIVAELTGDAAPDLALLDQPAGRNNGKIVVLLNDSSGRFASNDFDVGCPFFTGGAPCRLLGLAAADVDRDNRTDLVVTLTDPRSLPAAQDALQVLPGRGDGRFHFGGVFTVPKDPTALVGAEMTGDCLPDLLLTSRRALTLEIYGNRSSPGYNLHGNGTACAQPEECASNRCTHGRCCATACAADQRCDVPGSEGICTPVRPPAIHCTADPDCAGTAQPFCADGFCCYDACAAGRCDVPGLEGLCIPSLAAGSDCSRDEECLSGFCSDNFRCCLERCEGDFCDEAGVCHVLQVLGAPCTLDVECRSGICDTFDGICCNRRCELPGEFCGPTGRCEFGEPEAAGLPHPLIGAAVPRASRRQAAAAQLDAASCPADCDGDAAVSIGEIIRLISAALGTGVAGPCPGAAASPQACIAIGDIVLAVSQALSGCPAAGG